MEANVPDFGITEAFGATAAADTAATAATAGTVAAEGAADAAAAGAATAGVSAGESALLSSATAAAAAPITAADLATPEIIGGATSGLGWGNALAGAGTILAAGSKVNAGYNTEAEQTFLQNQDLQNANSSAASGQRAATNADQQTAFLQSRARAVSAASGGTSTDPTNVENSANIAGAGEYKALTSLYEGDTQAAKYTNEAQIAGYQAGQAVPAGWISGVGTLLQGSQSMFSKYAQNYS